jgi:pimeloyl-ACP methyl ester carboxylesterase
MMRFRRYFGILVIVFVAITSYFPAIYISGSRSFQEIDIPAEGYDLVGYISFGTNLHGPWVLFTHGNRKDGQAYALYQLIRNNIAKEVSVLAIDFRGYGKSTFGRLLNGQPVLNRGGDIDAAVNYLRKNYGVRDSQIILVGHSLGAVQVLNASKFRDYRMVIAIGPSDFNIFANNQIRMNRYIEKFKRNTGVTISPEQMIAEASQLKPESLFSSCHSAQIVLIFGMFDNPETLLFHRDGIPEKCESRIKWFVIPISDHMYGTEAFLPGPFHFSYMITSLGLLKWRLNDLLASKQ